MGECLALYKELGPEGRQGVADWLNNLGNVAFEQGDDTAARAYYQESLAVQRELGDRRGIAIALDNLGNIALRQGDPILARTHYEESLAIQENKHENSQLDLRKPGACGVGVGRVRPGDPGPIRHHLRRPL